MRRSPDPLNRVVLGLFGLALLVFGAWGVARGAGWLGTNGKHESLLFERVQRFVERNAHWFWPVVAAGCLVVALLAAGWLWAQLRPTRGGGEDLVERRGGGTTRVGSHVLTAALEADIVECIDDVREASARFAGDREDGHLDVRLDLNEDAGIVEVRRAVEEEVLPRFTDALGINDLRTDLHLRIRRGAGKRRVA
jgi:hypothetical protein